jgi:hypothetical protein
MAALCCGRCCRTYESDGPPAPRARIDRHRRPALPESILIEVHGFTIELLVRLIGDGLATAAPEKVKAGGRTIDVTRVPSRMRGVWRSGNDRPPAVERLI